MIVQVGTSLEPKDGNDQIISSSKDGANSWWAYNLSFPFIYLNSGHCTTCIYKALFLLKQVEEVGDDGEEQDEGEEEDEGAKVLLPN